MVLFADAGPQGFGVGADRVDQFTPWGSQVFTDKNRRVATTTLSPEQQALFDQQQMAQSLLGQRSIGMAGALQAPGAPVFGGKPFSLGDAFSLDGLSLPKFGAGAQTGGRNPFRLETMLGGMTTADAFSGDRDRVEKAQFDRMMSLMNPQFDRQEASMQQRLANQGLPQASRAYTAETGRFDDTRNQATEQAAMAAVLAGGDEQSRMLRDLLGTSTLGLGQAQQQRDNLLRETLSLFGANTDAKLAERGVRTDEKLAERGVKTSEKLAERQIPLNELLAMMGLNQVGMPQFGQHPGANIAGAQMGAQGAAGKNALFGDLIGGLLGAGGSVGAGYMMGG